MKLKKQRVIIGIVSILILLVSLVITLCDAFVPWDIWLHPILTFLFCIFIGFGVLCMAMGFAKKSVWFFFISALLIGLALIYAIAMTVGDKWWIGFIIVPVVWAIFGILSVIYNGNRTEDIALNKSPDYKNYEQRKAEKEAAEAAEPEKELPKIKSFKDNSGNGSNG